MNELMDRVNASADTKRQAVIEAERAKERAAKASIQRKHDQDVEFAATLIEALAVGAGFTALMILMSLFIG